MCDWMRESALGVQATAPKDGAKHMSMAERVSLYLVAGGKPR